MPGRVNGFTLAYTAAGAVVLWSGIKGTTLNTTFKGLLSGTAPTADEEPTGATAATAAAAAGAGLTAGLTPGSPAYSGSALQKLWTANGGSSKTAAIAEAIAMAESSGSATVTSANPDGGTNVGVWQLDTRGVGTGYTVAQLQNANLNARITVLATKNGTDWTEWGDPVADALPGHRYTPGAPVPG